MPSTPLTVLARIQPALRRQKGRHKMRRPLDIEAARELIEDLRKERDWALELLGKAAPPDLLAEVQVTDYVLLNKYC